MKENYFSFTYEVFESEAELAAEDLKLLQTARKAASIAYAPYSGFLVGAAALLVNGKIITGSNQENASYPAGLCAERSLLASAAQQYPETAIATMAISYNNTKGNSNVPASPCGFCRQVLSEFEKRVKKPIRLLLSGSSGSVIIIPKSSFLLPLGFNADSLL